MSYKKINLVLFSFQDMNKFLVVSSEPDYNPMSLLPKLTQLLVE